MRALIFLALMAAAAPAHADDGNGDGVQDTALSLQLTSVGPSSVSVQIEHDLDAHKLSLAAGLGVRRAAMGDYGSVTVGGGVELRRWFGRRATMRGWFGAVRLDAGRTVLEQETEDRRIGSLWTVASSIALGYRFVFWDRVELTPSLGASTIAEGGMDGRSPWTARTAGLLGLTAGWMF
jgi:hypothetical protein